MHNGLADQLPPPYPSTKAQRLTITSLEFAVNGSGIPEVNFDIGESYAGRLPITTTNTTNSTLNELFFWFFPSDNELASNEITIWLNGGPGCSSMDGLLQESGPFLWQSGTYSPQPNPFSWTNLTNVIYIDQPIGTGLSRWAPGAPRNVRDETDVATDFAGFWQNFINTFDLQGVDVYITGESYAGMVSMMNSPPVCGHFREYRTNTDTSVLDSTSRISQATFSIRTIRPIST